MTPPRRVTRFENSNGEHSEHCHAISGVHDKLVRILFFRFLTKMKLRITGFCISLHNFQIQMKLTLP